MDSQAARELDLGVPSSVHVYTGALGALSDSVSGGFLVRLMFRFAILFPGVEDRVLLCM